MERHVSNFPWYTFESINRLGNIASVKYRSRSNPRNQQSMGARGILLAVVVVMYFCFLQ
jgi:hypothetical protein